MARTVRELARLQGATSFSQIAGGAGGILGREMKDGLHPGLSYEQYAAIPAVRHSFLKLFDSSAKHAREEMLNPRESSEAQEIGIATHAALLEPEQFKRDYVVAPVCDRRTNAGKAAWKDFENVHAGKTILEAHEYNTMTALIQCMREHPLASQLLAAPGHNEATIVWTDSETGIRCKGRLDRLALWLGWSVVLDLKTCANAKAERFFWTIKDMHYDSQAAFYLDGLNAIQPAERRHITLAAQKKPTDVVCYEITDKSLERGRQLYRGWLAAYRRCMDSGKWPGISDGLEPIGLGAEE